MSWKHTAYYLDYVGEWVEDVSSDDIMEVVKSIAGWQQAGHGTKLESFRTVITEETND